MNNENETNSDNVISIKKASGWTEEWRNQGQVNTNDIKAFLIPTNDIMQLIQEYQNPEYVRGYMAINGDGEYKMVFVGVEQDENGHYNDVVIPDENGVIINQAFDFTKPCPHTCDTKESPLLVGYSNEKE